MTPIDPAKFRDPSITAAGQRRASVSLRSLDTLWFNTGTLCNLTCRNCYIESSPRNDALAYLSAADVAGFLDEINANDLKVRDVGFTGGEPFLNREFPAMLEMVLGRGLRALVLTNAMKPMMHASAALVRLDRTYPGQLTVRVSLDHYTADLHDLERGAASFAATMEGLRWLAETGIRLHVAGRAAFGGETEAELRAGYARLFAAHRLPIDADDNVALMLFPEMDATADVPEITEACWGILNRSPDTLMCASSRMVVKRRGAARPAVLACTLLAYDPQFELGETLAQASGPVALNHPHCARFCVLGGASCVRA